MKSLFCVLAVLAIALFVLPDTAHARLFKGRSGGGGCAGGSCGGGGGAEMASYSAYTYPAAYSYSPGYSMGSPYSYSSYSPNYNMGYACGPNGCYATPTYSYPYSYGPAVTYPSGVYQGGAMKGTCGCDGSCGNCPCPKVSPKVNTQLINFDSGSGDPVPAATSKLLQAIAADQSSTKGDYVVFGP